MAKIIKCKTCGSDIASNAKSCPGCGAKNKKPFYTKVWFWVLVLFVIGAGSSGGSSSNKSSTVSSSNKSSTVSSSNKSSGGSSSDKSSTVSSSSTSGAVTSNSTEKENVVTVGEKAALDKSNDYLSIMCFSKEGLRDQLEYDGFTTEEIDYAISNQSVDWAEQALGKGKEYMNIMSFSKSGLKDQLLYDGFTDEQATHAVNKIFQ